jgi:phosphoglycolate phosphatase
MPLGKVKLAMIDLDGTLVDSLPDLATAANATLVELGLPEVSTAVIQSYIGQGIADLVMRFVGGGDPQDARVLAALPRFQQHYARANGRHTSVYPGVISGLNWLRAAGIPLACVTNKAQAFSEPLLTQLGLRDYFVQVVSGDTVAHKKPHPLPLLYACECLGVAPQHALMIGDSVHDVNAARRAGCQVLGVSYGYASQEEVATWDCDGILPDFSQINRFLIGCHDD